MGLGVGQDAITGGAGNWARIGGGGGLCSLLRRHYYVSEHGYREGVSWAYREGAGWESW